MIEALAAVSPTTSYNAVPIVTVSAATIPANASHFICWRCSPRGCGGT